MIKKILTIFAILFFSATTISVVAPTPASAGNLGVDSSCANGFLGFTSWNCGVNFHDGEGAQEDLKKSILIIAVNIFNDIIILAAYLVLGYVIYGGYLYIFSGGDPGKVATGKKALSQAFIGLAIVLSANLILSTIRFALLGGGGNFSNCATTECVAPGIIITNAIQWAIGIAGIVAAIFVVYGGISYTSSNGDPGKVQKAKQMIIYAMIGLVIVALAEVITAFVSNMIKEADNKASFINQTTISKEVHENHQIH